MTDSFINTLAEIWAYQQCRPAIIQTGTQALHRLVPIALGRTAAGKTVGRFLLGLYDGASYPFDFEHLHRLDAQDFEDCLQVLKMDYTPEVEIHERIAEGKTVWRELLEQWPPLPVEPCPQAQRRPRKSAAYVRNGAIEAKGVQAFDRLLQVAETRSGQSHVVAMFLMSLIHHNCYRLNLTDLRGLDIKLFDDCISVLRMDYLTDIEAGQA